MTSALKKLAGIGAPIRAEAVDARMIGEKLGDENAERLRPLLQMKNGLYAFEQALHVFSDFGTTNEKGIVEWNSDQLWRQDYKGMADGAVFFAEDVFGTQSDSRRLRILDRLQGRS